MNPRTDERTAKATELLAHTLSASGYQPSGVAESDNGEAMFNFVVNIDGNDYHVEVAACVVESN